MKKTLIGITLGLLLGGSTLAQEMPNPPPEQCMYIKNFMIGRLPAVALGYDTDADGWEDTRFVYLVNPHTPFQGSLRLIRYGIDSNRDKIIQEDEMFDVPPKEKPKKQEETI